MSLATPRGQHQPINAPTALVGGSGVCAGARGAYAMFVQWASWEVLPRIQRFQFRTSRARDRRGRPCGPEWSRVMLEAGWKCLWS